MSTAELAKSLQRWATNGLTGNRIVFHHVPKCGGTSAGRALRRAYILSQGTVTPRESEQAFDAVRRSNGRVSIGDVSELREMMLLYMLHSDVRCVSAHIPFSNAAFDEFADRYGFVTLLRDPVARFISNYFWSHKHPDGVQYVAESLEDFVESERAQRLGSTYARYFCGEPAQKRFTARHADAAIRNLRRMHFVGFLDEVPRFEKALRLLTGRRLRIGSENVGGTSGRRDAIMSGPLRDRILAACSIDLEIWNAVQDLRNRRATAVAGESRS
jgi:Sulfotransferase family